MPSLSRHLMWYVNSNNKRGLELIYEKKLSDVDLIVFAGGRIIECSQIMIIIIIIISIL